MTIGLIHEELHTFFRIEISEKQFKNSFTNLVSRFNAKCAQNSTDNAD